MWQVFWDNKEIIDLHKIHPHFCPNCRGRHTEHVKSFIKSENNWGEPKNRGVREKIIWVTYFRFHVLHNRWMLNCYIHSALSLRSVCGVDTAVCVYVRFYVCVKYRCIIFILKWIYSGYIILSSDAAWSAFLVSIDN